MKKVFYLVVFFAVITCIIIPGYAFDIPQKPSGYVNDYTSTLALDQITALETKIENFKQVSSNEIAIVIIQSLDGDVIENVAQELFETWGIGGKENNNGVLLLVAMKDRQSRIHTGYGLEGVLPDVLVAHMLDEIILPAFQKEQYYEGIDTAIDAIIIASKGEYANSPVSNTNVPWLTIIIFGWILTSWLGSVFARSKSWWLGGVLGGLIGGVNVFFHILPFSNTVNIISTVGLIGLGFLFDYVVSKSYIVNTKRGISHPWWGGGSWGGGSGGGGFRGFGGGNSGGGGSSGSW